MIRAAALLLLLLSLARGAARAAPVVAPEAAAFPADYLRSVSLSLSAEPFFASHLLESFHAQLTSVSAIPTAPAAAAYLAQSAVAGGSGLSALRAAVGREPLAAKPAAALLIANSLARPEQFREISDGLETLKPGLGRRAAEMLKSVSGRGDPALLAALRAAGLRRPLTAGLTYGPDGNWAYLFDGSRAAPTRPDDDAPSLDPNAVDPAARARLPVLTKPR